MQKQKISLIIGIILALIAVAMTKVYIDQQRIAVQEKAKKTLAQIQASQVAVLVAKNDIPKGASISPDMLETAVVISQYRQSDAASSLDRVAGMVTAVPIPKGDQITLNKLTSPKQMGAGALAEVTPVGKRAITISVDNMASLAGMLKPGDYVDVVASVPVPVQTAEGKQASQVAVMPLFQNVLVLAVGQDTGSVSAGGSRYKKEEKKEMSPLITLALNPQEANLMAFVQEQGKVSLTLRSPADSQIQPVQPASWEALFQYIMPQQFAQDRNKKEVPVDTGPYVEIYRGLNKDKIPLTNNR